MANKKEKSNVEHLRDILKTLESHHSADTTEAQEFLDAIEKEWKEETYNLREEIIELEDQVRSKTTENDELSSRVNELEEEPEYDNTEYFGLDTLYWKLESGNLIVQPALESFFHELKVKYGMQPA